MPNITLEEITKLVGLQLGKRQVHATDRLVEDLGAESADIANLAARVEEQYGITIKEAQIARIFTAADLYALIQKNQP